MSDSFTTNQPPEETELASGGRKVLVTGAAGRIGSYFAKHGHRKYDLRLMVLENDEAEHLELFGEVVVAELHELERVKELCQGVDTIVHLAADPSPNATWRSVRENNIAGTYNVFVAAKAARVRRVVYASSIHAVSGYPKDVQVKPDDPVNPADLYGVSKCFGEALARYMAEQEGVSTLCVRIGAFQSREQAGQAPTLDMMDAFVSHRDLNQLLQRCVDAAHVRFAIVHGLSDNRFKRLDISRARELLGYAPEDDFTELNPQLKQFHLREQGANVLAGRQSGLREDL